MLFERLQAEVNITLPKFKLESTTNLIQPLSLMGINDLFSTSANLPYLANDPSIQVTDAKQQASIDVNEEGTIAISLTQFVAVGLSVQMPVPNVDFIVDRPFVAIVANRETQIPLIIAKVSNPK